MHADLDRAGKFARLLRELPDEAIRPYGFGEFERRARLREHAAASRAGAHKALAAAVLAVGALALCMRFGGFAPRLAQVPPTHAGAGSLRPALAQAAPAARAELVDGWLASLPSEPPVVRVGTRAAVTGLEDRIAQIDDLLSAARTGESRSDRVIALQRERARLMGTLLQVRYAETLADVPR
jgi:hypothetical protein